MLFEESVSLDDLVQQSRQEQEPDGAELPCAINGLTSGLSGGVLGYAFGFGETLGPPLLPRTPNPTRWSANLSSIAWRDSSHTTAASKALHAWECLAGASVLRLSRR